MPKKGKFWPFYFAVSAISITFAAANLLKMIETLVISTIIVAFCVLLLSVKILLKKDGKFPSMHIHDSEAMRERGIHCVVDQDREARMKAARKEH